MNFASFKSVLGKAYETAASTAATAAKDIQSQVPDVPILLPQKYARSDQREGLHSQLTRQ